MTRRTQGNLKSNLQSESVLNHVHEGMDVYTSDDKHIGKVERVYFGVVSEQEAATGTGAVTNDDPRMQQHSWVEEMANVFRTDEIPDEVRERLQRLGFIRIDAKGLFSSDRYATPDQIATVRDDRVILTADRDTLFKG
ncbi:hypothetical protein GC175_34025 [bacterium]|nr:hypothetical protein [bacterium]